ncbi:hypothetical protein D3C78_814430 [compost metagenome]
MHRHLWCVARLLIQVQAVQVHHVQVVLHRQYTAQARIAEQQGDARIAHQIAQALPWVGRVQRHISATGLEHRQQGDNHLLAARQGHADPHVRADAFGNQGVGQTVGARLDLPVAEGLTGEHHRRLLRVLPRPLRDALVYRQRHCLHRRCGNSLDLPRDQPHSPQRLCGVSRQRIQQAFHIAANTFHRRRIEMLAQEHVFDHQAVFQGDHQVHREVGQAGAAAVAKTQGVIAELAQGLIDRVVFEDDDAVEQRLPGTPGPALHVGQRCVFTLAHVQVVVLHIT